MKELEIKKLPQLPFDMTEALNQLRINLGFCGDQIKTIMVTSSVPNEGKSFITMQLWKMMAEVGSPVLLIDCDFRNSEMRRKYSIGSANGEKLVGAAHYLAGQADIQDVIYKTNIPNGYMIPVTSAIANPTILLESPNFARMLEYCEQRFACVLVDTPSVLVIRSGSTPRKVVQDSVQMLKRAESPLLGVVLNRADVSGRSSAYYHRYYHSNYYYKNGYRYGSYGNGSGHGHSRNKKEDNGGK